jgi:hypothetical protein
MAFAIKAEVCDPWAKTFVFTAQKAMYGGKHIAEDDTVFVFASENEGGQGLIARGVVTAAEAIAKKRGIARQTPRVSVTIKRTALAKRPLGRSELKHFIDWNDGQPGTELILNRFIAFEAGAGESSKPFRFVSHPFSKLAAVPDGSRPRWFGFSTIGALLTFSRHSNKACSVFASTQARWVLRTSFRPLWYRRYWLRMA